MGATVSAGADNDELVDNLLEADYIKTLAVERVFRAVDRGHYFTLESRENAYKDLAWKYGNVHISAPCIYSEVMENLQLAPGMSFLNLGSGTGYLSTMAGLILGANGINHGVEIHEDVLEYAKKKLEDFYMTSPALDEYEFCHPKFVSGNCLNLDADTRQYDRVYCGAACPENHENYMKNLIKVGGILVMPINNQLLQIYRISENLWETRTVLPVSFASLISNSADNVEPVKLPDVDPLSLQDICRFAIRSILRQQINKEHPELRSDTLQESKMRIKKRTLRKFVIPIFGNNADNQGDITPEDLNGLRDFGRRGFLMDVQSVRSCRTLLELLPGPSNRMATSGEEANAEAEYDDYDEDEYEDLDDYEGLEEEELQDVEIDDNDEEDESVDDGDDDDDEEDDDDDAEENIEVDVDDRAEFETQDNDMIDIARALQGSDNPEEERGTDEPEMMETDGTDGTDMVMMTRSRARKSARMSAGKDGKSSTKKGTKNSTNIGNRSTTKGSTKSCTKTSTKSSTKTYAKSSTIPTSSKMVTRSSARNAKTSPTVGTNSTGNSSRMTTRSTARRSVRNAISSSTMITRSAARRRGSPRAMSRMNTRMSTRMNNMMSSMIGSRMRPRMGLRPGNRAGSRMAARMGARMAARMGARMEPSMGPSAGPSAGPSMGPSAGPSAGPSTSRRADQEVGLDDTLGSQFLRHISMSDDPETDQESYMENFDPDEKILVKFEDSDTESFMNDTSDDRQETIANYSTYMREKIKLLPLPMALKYFINFNRDL